MNNRDKISLSVLIVILSAVAAYFSGQISISQSLGDRPTRSELAAAVKDEREIHNKDMKASQDQTERQLNALEKQQEKGYSEMKAVNDKVDKLNEKIDKILFELRFKNAGR